MKKIVALGLLSSAFALFTWRYIQAEDAIPAGEDRKLFLSTVGLLASSQVYQAYLNVGLVADGKAAGLYTAKQGHEILKTIHELLAAADRQLEKISTLPLAQGDRDALFAVRRLSASVRAQAEELNAFWTANDPQRGAQYEKQRQEAWQGLSKLIGIAK